jgi:hypothetical protein
MHRFWGCSHSALAWNLLSEEVGCSLDKPPARLACHSDLKGWLLDWIGKSKGKQVSWILMMVYNLWAARNEARKSRRIDDPLSIAKRTAAGVEEWLGLHSPAPSKKRENERWLPQEEGWHKANIDGAFTHSKARGGGGVVIRNCHGSFVAGACHFFPHVVDVEGA